MNTVYAMLKRSCQVVEANLYLLCRVEFNWMLIVYIGNLKLKEVIIICIRIRHSASIRICWLTKQKNEWVNFIQKVKGWCHGICTVCDWFLKRKKVLDTTDAYTMLQSTRTWKIQYLLEECSRILLFSFGTHYMNITVNRNYLSWSSLKFFF